LYNTYLKKKKIKNLNPAHFWLICTSEISTLKAHKAWTAFWHTNIVILKGGFTCHSSINKYHRFLWSKESYTRFVRDRALVVNASDITLGRRYYARVACVSVCIRSLKHLQPDKYSRVLYKPMGYSLLMCTFDIFFLWSGFLALKHIKFFQQLLVGVCLLYNIQNRSWNWNSLQQNRRFLD
jgi:hypothetical protein